MKGEMDGLGLSKHPLAGPLKDAHDDPPATSQVQASAFISNFTHGLVLHASEKPR